MNTFARFLKRTIHSNCSHTPIRTDTHADTQIRKYTNYTFIHICYVYNYICIYSYLYILKKFKMYKYLYGSINYKLDLTSSTYLPNRMRMLPEVIRVNRCTNIPKHAQIPDRYLSSGLFSVASSMGLEVSVEAQKRALRVTSRDIYPFGNRVPIHTYIIHIHTHKNMNTRTHIYKVHT